MAIIGPRPLLVRYLDRYNEEQRHRHDVRPGLTGYAQAHGRNAVSWEDKFAMDVWYTTHITLVEDIKIIIDTDVIVSTDSPEVKIIAEQMGAKIKWRDASLCGDAVTLDAVVADAVPINEHWDYIVTMQPTSPTLRVITLDHAIEYTVNNGLDTVGFVYRYSTLQYI